MPVFYGRLQKFKHTKDPKWLTINKWTKMDVISWCGEIKRIDATHLTRYSICLCLFIVQRIWLKIWFLPFSLHSVLTGRLGAHDLSCALHSHPTITHCWLGIKLYTSNFMGRRVRTAQTANMTVVRRLYWWRVCAFLSLFLLLVFDFITHRSACAAQRFQCTAAHENCLIVIHCHYKQVIILCVLWFYCCQLLLLIAINDAITITRYQDAHIISQCCLEQRQWLCNSINRIYRSMFQARKDCDCGPGTKKR